MGLRDAFRNTRHFFGGDQTGMGRAANFGAGRIGGMLGAAAGPGGAIVGSLLGQFLQARMARRGANALPGSPSPAMAQNGVSQALGIHDYAHGQIPDAGTTTQDPFAGAQSFGAASGPFSGAMAQGQGSRVGGGQNLGAGQAPGFGWSGSSDRQDIANALEAGGFFGNFGPSMADYMTARWQSTRQK